MAERREEKGEMTVDMLLPPFELMNDLPDICMCISAGGGDLIKAKEIYETWDLGEVAKWKALKDAMEYQSEDNNGNSIDGES